MLFGIFNITFKAHLLLFFWKFIFKFYPFTYTPLATLLGTPLPLLINAVIQLANYGAAYYNANSSFK